MANILEQLNKEQRDAVEAYKGPVMVIAGAGSGKTRVLTYRVAHLLNVGVDSFRILALTFTNKAAREMKERILKLVGNGDARNVWMGTFHSVFARVLRAEGHRFGFPSNFTIYDSDDSKRLIRTIIKENNLDDKVYIPNYVLGRISASKTNLITAQDYVDSFEITQQDTMAGKPMLGKLYQIYSNRCRRASAMDFDDLLLFTYILLRDFPDVLIKYQRRFQYVLVDEYQDTNRVQYMILKKLVANDENICVVGDDAQSIYAFRGANIQNILNFKNDYPDAKEFKLEQNYRSTKTIVNAANSIIKNNKDQIFKEVWTQNDNGDLVQIMKAGSDIEEGRMVANAIFEQKMNGQLQNDAFAILYRTNAQSRSLEEALRKLNIPYRIYGGLSFYNRKEIKDLLAYFRLAVNNNDEEALKRVINYPARGIGKTSLERVIVAAAQNNVPLWDIIKETGKYALQINSGTLSKISAFVAMVQSFSVQLKTHNAIDLAKLITSSSGIRKDLFNDKSPEGVSRHENIEELLNAIKDFTEKEREPDPGKDDDPETAEEDNSIRTLDEFMQDVALLTDADSQDKNSGNKVTLMTIHAAKGLEFPHVFIVGIEENLFPSIMSLGSRQDLEEERRLFYVAITRAEKKLTLSFAESRYKWGNVTLCEPSRFLEEIDPKYIDFPRKPVLKIHEKRTSAPAPGQIPLANRKLKKIKGEKSPTIDTDNIEVADIGKIQPGLEVQHSRFGKGKVLTVEGEGASKKAAIFFNAVGQKQLLLKYAKLKIL